MMNNYWLFKSEPQTFSIEHLQKCFQQTTSWDGVRNFQARNFLRDQCKKGDLVLFYHSNATPPAAVGIAMIVKEGYVDQTAFDSKDKHFDPKSKKEKPTWYLVDVKFVSQFRKPVPLDAIKKNLKLNKMVLVQPGSRLSIQPVTPEEFEEIVKMGQ